MAVALTKLVVGAAKQPATLCRIDTVVSEGPPFGLPTALSDARLNDLPLLTVHVLQLYGYMTV